MDIPSVRETPWWDLKRQTRSCPLGRVVDPLELVIDDIAIGPSKEGSVTAEELYAPVVAHIDQTVPISGGNPSGLELGG